MEPKLTDRERHTLEWLDIAADRGLPAVATSEHRNVLPALKARRYVTTREVNGEVRWVILTAGRSALARADK